MDGNIERVVARLHAFEEELPAGKPRLHALAAALVPAERPGDFAQAMMDLGATICTPKKPACALCPWNEACAARQRGYPELFPRKAHKAEGRLRRGAAFWVTRRDGFALVRTRAATGLLGGMTEVPGTAWSHDFDLSDAHGYEPLPARWRRLPGVVTHTFTHFPLELTVYAAEVAADTAAPHGMRWVALEALNAEALPSLMRKVVAHAMGAPVGWAKARPKRRAHVTA